MFFSIALLIGFISITVFLGYKKHITWVFTCYFTGAALLAFGSMIYTLRISSYETYHELDRYLYYHIYPVFSRFNLSLGDTSSVINFGLMLILFGSVCQIKILNRTSRLNFLIYTGLILLFGVLNHHQIRYFEFIYEFDGSEGIIPSVIRFITKYTNTYSIALFITSLIVPHFFLIRMIIKTKIYALKQDAIATVVCLIMLDIFIVYYFLFGVFSPFLPWNVNLLKTTILPVRFQQQMFYNQYLFLICCITLYILIKYNPFGSRRFRTKRTIIKEYTELNHSLRMIFHVNKNILQTIYLLSDQAINYFEKKSEITLKNLNDIKQMSEESQETLIRMMHMLDDVSINNLATNVISDIELALTKSGIPNHIKITKKYNPEDIINIKAESIHVTECFINILKNAVEAINEIKRENGSIEIFISTEQGYANIEVTDNGCGIERKKQKSVFNILSSSKQNSKNWGIGLAYVKKVTDVYNGGVFIKSEVNKYTKFQIIFPLDTKQERMQIK